MNTGVELNLFIDRVSDYEPGIINIILSYIPYLVYVYDTSHEYIFSPSFLIIVDRNWEINRIKSILNSRKPNILQKCCFVFEKNSFCCLNANILTGRVRKIVHDSRVGCRCYDSGINNWISVPEYQYIESKYASKTSSISYEVNMSTLFTFRAPNAIFDEWYECDYQEYKNGN